MSAQQEPKADPQPPRARAGNLESPESLRDVFPSLICTLAAKQAFFFDYSCRAMS